MRKDDLIISLLKSKESIAELFNDNNNNDNLYDDETSDIRRILNRLKDMLPKKIERKLKISYMKQNIKAIFQKKNKKKMMNTLENQ